MPSYERMTTGLPSFPLNERPGSETVDSDGFLKTVLDRGGGTSAIGDLDPTDPQQTEEIPSLVPCGLGWWGLY